MQVSSDHAFSKEHAEVFDKRKVVQGSKGSYRAVSFVAKGSGGAIYSAVRLRQGESRCHLGRLMMSAVKQTKEESKFVTMFKTVQESQLVIKKIYDTQRDSAEQEYEVGGED